MSREVELNKVIAEATAAKAKAQAELIQLQAQSEAEAEKARDEIVRQAERLLELASDFSNTHRLDGFTVEISGGYGEEGYGTELEWYSEGTRNWNASTC